MRETRQFRGISTRLAAEYLETLGGELDDDGDRIEGDSWSAELEAASVNPVGSIELSEVTVTFEGDEATLEPLIERFARKAIRAGG
jgi:hypothetical protein